MAEHFDPYHVWLGIQSEDQPPNHYRLLGISDFEDNTDVIESAADRQMAHLRTFQIGKHSAISQKLLNEVAAARVTLLNPQKKAAYDEALRQRLAAANGGKQEESGGSAQWRAELAEIAEASHHLPVRQVRRGTPIWAWAVVATIVAAIAIGILWFATRRPTDIAKRSPEQAKVVKTTPVPATPKSRPEAPVAKKADVSSPPAMAAQETPAKPPLKSDLPPAPPGPSATSVRDPTPVAPAASPAPATRPTTEPTMAKPPAIPPPAPTPASQPEVTKPPEPRTPVKQRLPVPDAPDVEQARKAAEALFKTEVAKAKTSADKVALAKRLLAQATDQAGAADKYVLFLLARDLLAAAKEADTTFQAVDQTAEAFEVDRFALKTEILSGWAKDARTSDARKWVVEQMLVVGEEAIDAGELEAAKELNKLAGSRASGVREVAQKMKVYRQRLAEAGKDAEELKEAQATLAKDPKDPKANLTLGRYLCFSKGDWKKGLSLLALGSDQRLKELAGQELGPPPSEPGQQVALADAWWEIASFLGHGQASAVKLHAGHWYKQGVGSLPEGLVKNKVDQRLREVVKLRSALPQPPLAIAPFDENQAKQHQQRWAEYLGVPVEMSNSIGMKLVLIPPGEFEMGSTKEEIEVAMAAGRTQKENSWYFERVPTEGPRHLVRISKPLYLGVFEVTQGEYEQVMGRNRSFADTPAGVASVVPPLNATQKQERESGAKKVAAQDASRHPVVMVSWEDAKAFWEKLSCFPAERAAGRVYRLPTEAEWEYACRAGTMTRWYTGDDEAGLGEAAWYKSNSNGQTHPVGQKRPNAFGLYDMHGNAWEWCMDWFGAEYYAQSPPADPSGPAKGSNRVNRGGACNYRAVSARAALRHDGSPGHRSGNMGFRVLAVPSR